VVATLHLPPGSALVATPHWLWVLGGPSGVVTQVDPARNNVVRTVHPPHPPSYGTYSEGSLWIASLRDSAVMRLDADSGKVLRTIESSHGKPFFRPIGIVAAGHDLWVVNHADDRTLSSLTRLNARTGAVTGTAPLTGHHAGGPMVASGTMWVAMTTEGTVERLDPATGRTVGSPITVDTGTCLSGSAAAAALWYTGLDDEEGGACRTVGRRLDPQHAELSPTRYGEGKKLVQFASIGNSVWASDIGHTIYSVDVVSGAVDPALTLEGPDQANGLIAAFDSLWAFGGEAGRLTRIAVS
jgi:streptogramin lyase